LGRRRLSIGRRCASRDLRIVFRITIIGMAQQKINGAAVDETQLQEWVKEAEAGYPLEMLRKRGRKPLGDGASEVVPVRMDQTLLNALAARAEREHVSRSEAIRAAVRDWVNVA